MKAELTTEDIFTMGRAAERAGFEDMTEFSRHAVMNMAKRVLGRDFTPAQAKESCTATAAAPATATK